MSNCKKEVFRKDFNEILFSDVIERFKSPVVLVPKNDSKWLVCIDFRKLNALTKVD